MVPFSMPFKILKLVGVVLVAMSLTGCALTTGIRFGDDGSVSAPEVHGGVSVSGTVPGR